MTTKKSWTPDRGDIVEIDDEELNTVGELLVLSPTAYNERTRTVIGLVVSSSESHATNPFAIPLPASRPKSTRLRYVLGNSPKTVKWVGKSIAANRTGNAPEEVMAQSCTTLNQIISIGE